MALINVPDIQNLDAATPELWNSRFGTIANEINGNLDANNLKDGAVTAPKLATDSVTTGKIPDAAVTPAKWYNPYKFSATMGTTLAVSANAWTKAPLDTEQFDTNSNFDTTNNRYVAPVNGFYLFNAQVAISVSGISAGYGEGALYKNGSLLIHSHRQAGSGSASTLPKSKLDCLLQLNAGDYIELYGYCSEGGRHILSGIGETYLMGHLVSQT